MTLKKDTKTPKTKKPIYKRIWFWILIVFILFAAVGGKGNKSSETASPAADAATESVSSGLSAPADDDVSKESEAETEAADSALDFQVTYYDSFRNDVTGNWRKALVVTDKPIEDYALDYYDKHGRFPSWADAMEHCDPEVKEVWTKALEAEGVKVERKPEIDTLDIQISQEAVDT